MCVKSTMWYFDPAHTPHAASASSIYLHRDETQRAVAAFTCMHEPADNLYLHIIIMLDCVNEQKANG